MRFNSAVLARRRQEIGRISDGERQQAQRERSIRQLVASAFAKKGTLRLTRKAYHSYMQKSYDMQSMATMGFTKAKPRASLEANGQKQRLQQCLTAFQIFKTGMPRSTPRIRATFCPIMACSGKRALHK